MNSKTNKTLFKDLKENLNNEVTMCPMLDTTNIKFTCTTCQKDYPTLCDSVTKSMSKEKNKLDALLLRKHILRNLVKLFPSILLEDDI